MRARHWLPNQQVKQGAILELDIFPFEMVMELR
jgi:hypothetical protein